RSPRPERPRLPSHPSRESNEQLVDDPPLRLDRRQPALHVADEPARVHAEEMVESRQDILRRDWPLHGVTGLRISGANDVALADSRSREEPAVGARPVLAPAAGHA